MSRTVAVVGGGAIGLMTGYHLARAGADVVVLETRATGLGAAAVNAGWVCPAESAPVPGPGMIAKSLKWMMHRDSPLYIRPSASPAFVKFMLGMWRSSNAVAQRKGFEAHLRLAQGTVRAFDDYRADGMNFELSHNGLLMAFIDADNLDRHREHLDLVRQFDLDPQVFLGDEVRAHEPQLSDQVYGGIYFPKEQYLDPEALMRELHRRLVELGGTVVERAPLTQVRRAGSRVTHVVSGGQVIAVDDVVLAAGAWTGPLSRLFDACLPVRPGKGYSVDIAPLGLRSSINLSDAKVAVTPLDRNLRLAGTMEFGGLDEDLNQLRVGAILRAPAQYLRDWAPPAAADVTPRAGIRPMTPDGLPIMGRLGDLDNAYVSTGHGMLGITLGPGSASALADLVLHGRQHEVLAPFSPKRFSTRARLRSSRTSAA